MGVKAEQGQKLEGNLRGHKESESEMVQGGVQKRRSAYRLSEAGGRTEKQGEKSRRRGIETSRVQ